MDLDSIVGSKEVLQNNWMYRVKEEKNGNKRCNMRFMVKSFLQKKGIDNINIFLPVMKLTTTQIILVIVAAKILHLEQFDVETAFLHGNLEEKIYMM